MPSGTWPSSGGSRADGVEDAVRTVPTGNCARFAATPLEDGGTPTWAWLADRKKKPLPSLDLTGCAGLVIVAPHPDDETLGLGATAAHLAASGVEVQVVSVSDGGAAQLGASPVDRTRMEATRRGELLRATGILGVHPATSLGLPDGQLADHEERLTDLLVAALEDVAPGTWCAATWRGDGHPDHETIGRAAATACERTGVTLVEYPVWMWHWASPADPAVPWDRAYSVPVTNRAVNRKFFAAQCFQSQFETGDDGSAPVLPGFVLRRLLGVGELVFR
jgi:LmbE family N-acetylglucosaminyl deacetylase